MQDPSIVIFDEPTRGVDVGTIPEIHAQIRALADEGKAVVVISSYLPEVLAISDRILVARLGRIVAEIDGGPGDRRQDHVRRNSLRARRSIAAYRFERKKNALSGVGKGRRAQRAGRNRFMDRHVYPNEERFYREAEELGPWKVYPVVEELKPRAKSEGLWNLFLRKAITAPA